MTQDILPNKTPSVARDTVPARPGSMIARAGQKLLTAFFRVLVSTGRLTVIDPWGCTHVFGSDAQPAVSIRISTPAAFFKILLRPDSQVGECYMNGQLTLDAGNLRDFLYISTVNKEALYKHSLAAAFIKINKALRLLSQFNPKSRASANVTHHYDLSATLYDLFLDEDRQYSCAYFANGDETLEQAQYKKKQLITAKLLLQPGQKVLDIGCGWGGLALHLAQAADVDITGVTLSQEQFGVAEERARAAKLSDRVHFALRDYRDEDGLYDRIVSVGMFEHVGIVHYKDFFAKCHDLLKPDGIGLLHAIGRMQPPAATNSWIRKYIFPGGYCPALSEVLPAIEQAGLWVTDMEVLRPHYADTLRHWWDRFQANRDTVKALYDERFCRMWEFYLASSEVSFRTGRMMVFQIQFTRDRNAAPRTRNYLNTATV